MDESTSQSELGPEVKEESIVSMVDVLEEEKQYEEDANAVLGGSDPNKCTYDQGYLKRQALYACASCVKPEMDPAGICLACSLECHDGHDLYELYTKRNIRCDCGNSKFPDLKCKFFPERDTLNEKNVYSQNFKGTYCTCKRPYPDPEDDIEDEMIQCIVCEDWFHGRHTGQESIPEDFSEFICASCCLASDFLYLYATQYPKLNVSERKKVEMCNSNTDVDVDSQTKAGDSSTQAAGLENKDTPSPSTSATDNEPNSPLLAPENKAIQETLATTSVDSTHKEPDIVPPVASSSDTNAPPVVTDNNGCILEQLRANNIAISTQTGGRFWPEEWRRQLCKCDKCMKMYEEKKLCFLCDESDTIAEYEKSGRETNTDAYQQGISALQSIDRTQQVEVLTEFVSMKDQLTEYLKKFADNKKVVREEDIKEFFEGLKANKRQRTGMQHFCR